MHFVFYVVLSVVQLSLLLLFFNFCMLDHIVFFGTWNC